MKRVDRLIIAEMLGPWAFGVAIFTALIFASALLVKITDWVVKGISASTITELVLLMLPGIMVKTFAMAMLLSSLLGFGRLSNDSEVVALRAAGASLFRVMRPVLLFGIGVASLSFALNETVVPGAALRATALQTDIRKELDTAQSTKPVFYPIYRKGKLVGLVTARDFSLVSETLTGAHLVAYDDQGKAAYILFAKELRYHGPQDWHIKGGALLLSIDGATRMEIDDDAWPSQIERPTFTPRNLLAGFADDLDVFSMSQMAEEIRIKKADPTSDKGQIANLEFGYYNKIALPLGAVIFGLLGAPLGIRNHRAGVATGFALSIVLSFGYMMIVNFLAVYSRGGVIPPWAASFAPLLIGAAAACAAITKKNV